MGIPANEGQAMGGMGILSIVHMPTMLQHMHWQRKMCKIISKAKEMKKIKIQNVLTENL